MALILASASPRRKELLELLTHDFSICVSAADEGHPESCTPAETAALLSRRKARSVKKEHPDDIVIGADTVVAIDNKTLGKPCDDAQAAKMLKMLSGREHRVYTGVCVCSSAHEESFVCETAVRFSPLSESEIAEYVNSGECRDKAGAYGIQGVGARFIESIEGDYYSVMGLPVNRLYQALRKLITLPPL